MLNVDMHRGDSLAVLPTLTDDSVDAVITDPPYNSGGRTASERRETSLRWRSTCPVVAWRAKVTRTSLAITAINAVSLRGCR
ncbi:hypothetical protein [Kibdelosporangium philippinense]|uniref:hypothetical protein n=1 Tax=Kibdelosporangium philippinense TaxID=211113 RepID=UPI00361CA13B